MRLVADKPDVRRLPHRGNIKTIRKYRMCIKNRADFVEGVVHGAQHWGGRRRAASQRTLRPLPKYHQSEGLPPHLVSVVHLHTCIRELKCHKIYVSNEIFTNYIIHMTLLLHDLLSHRWYLAILVVFSVVFTCYRLCTLFFDQLRFALIYAKVTEL